MFGDVKEKDITLQVGFKTAQLLKDAGFDVVFTRSDDSFVPLDQRTRYGHEYDGDLFISLHANASSNHTVSGLETFCIQPHLFKSERVHMHHIDRKLVMHAKKELHTKSKKLADLVHNSVLRKAAEEHKKIKDRKVKYKASQVLLGSHIPAILIELGFLSHPQERNFLKKDTYQNRLAHGICDAVKKFIG